MLKWGESFIVAGVGRISPACGIRINHRIEMPPVAETIRNTVHTPFFRARIRRNFSLDRQLLEVS